MAYRLNRAGLALVLVAACSTEPGGDEPGDTESAEAGSDASGSGGSAEPLDRSDAPRAYAEARCEVAAACACGANALADEACVAEAEQRFQILLDDAEAAGLSYDPECGAELVPTQWTGCETLVESLQQDPQYQDPIADFPVCGACTRFLFGDLGAGAPCGVANAPSIFACEQGLSCRRGQCTDPCEQAEVGENCEETFCESGLQCDFTVFGEWTCVEPPAGGCGEGEVCDADEFCDIWETVTCVPRRPVDETCRRNECSTDAFCDGGASGGAEGVCAEKQADGSPCTAREQCVADWCDDGQCGTGAPLVCVFE